MRHHTLSTRHCGSALWGSIPPLARGPETARAQEDLTWHVAVHHRAGCPWLGTDCGAAWQPSTRAWPGALTQHLSTCWPSLSRTSAPDNASRAGVIYAPAALWAVVIIFYLDRDGHIDSRDHELTVAVDDRSRRHHPGHPNRPTSQRHCGDAAASGIPAHPDRYHGAIADHPVTAGLEDPAMEEHSA